MIKDHTLSVIFLFDVKSKVEENYCSNIVILYLISNYNKESLIFRFHKNPLFFIHVSISKTCKLSSVNFLLFDSCNNLSFPFLFPKNVCIILSFIYSYTSSYKNWWITNWERKWFFPFHHNFLFWLCPLSFISTFHSYRIFFRSWRHLHNPVNTCYSSCYKYLKIVDSTFHKQFNIMRRRNFQNN